jgi:hypothetical protein
MRLMEGRSTQLFNGLFSGRLARFIVVLFLTYAGVDIANPQLCSDDLIPLSVLQASNIQERVEEPSIGVSEDTEQQEDPSVPHSEDDCFCCCIHVVPAPTTHPNGASNVVLYEHISVPESVSSAHLKTLYRPPRSV